MRVVCKICSSLIDEKEAIKMNEVDYGLLRQNYYNIPFVQFTPEQYNRYIQICENCYNIYTNKEDKEE